MGIGGTNQAGGLDVGALFNGGIDSVNKKGEDLQAKMSDLLSKNEVSQTEMLQLQFEMGQYTAMMEALSSVTKSITDMLKTLAQRSG